MKKGLKNQQQKSTTKTTTESTTESTTELTIEFTIDTNSGRKFDTKQENWHQLRPNFCLPVEFEIRNLLKSKSKKQRWTYSLQNLTQLATVSHPNKTTPAPQLHLNKWMTWIEPCTWDPNMRGGMVKMDRKIITGTEKRIQKLNPIRNLEQISATCSCGPDHELKNNLQKTNDWFRDQHSARRHFLLLACARREWRRAVGRADPAVSSSRPHFSKRRRKSCIRASSSSLSCKRR